MGSASGKYSEGKMKGVSGKVDSGSATGDKQIPPNIGSGGELSTVKKVSSPGTWEASKALVPPTNVSPKGPPIAD